MRLVAVLAFGFWGFGRRRRHPETDALEFGRITPGHTSLDACAHRPRTRPAISFHHRSTPPHLTLTLTLTATAGSVLVPARLAPCPAWHGRTPAAAAAANKRIRTDKRKRTRWLGCVWGVLFGGGAATRGSRSCVGLDGHSAAKASFCSGVAWVLGWSWTGPVARRGMISTHQ